jgi:glycosyltransferase involved in cell wall biosynthesis
LEKIKRVIYIQQHIKNSGYHPPKNLIPNFITFGFAGLYGRNFKKNNPDYQVEVWRLDSSINKYIDEIIDDVTYRIFPAKGNKLTGIYSFKFIKSLKTLPEGTLLNVQNLHTLLLYHILIFAPKNIIVTAHQHGEWSPYFKAKTHKGFKKLYAYLLIFIEKLVINRIDHIVIIDKKSIPYLEMNIKNLHDRMSMGNTGIDYSYWKKIEKKEAKKLLGLDTNKKHLFYLGQYYELKAVDQLCDIYMKLKQTDPDIELVVAGGTPQDKFYKNIIQCGAKDFGFILNSELYKFYSAADVYVCISYMPNWVLGIGVAMLESLACGTPVVSNSLNQLPNTDDIKYIGRAPNNEAEMFHDILYILNHREEFNKCRDIIKRYEIFYDYKSIQRRMRDVYENLLKSNNTMKDSK